MHTAETDLIRATGLRSRARTPHQLGFGDLQGGCDHLQSGRCGISVTTFQLRGVPVRQARQAIQFALSELSQAPVVADIPTNRTKKFGSCPDLNFASALGHTSTHSRKYSDGVSLPPLSLATRTHSRVTQYSGRRSVASVRRRVRWHPVLTAGAQSSASHQRREKNPIATSGEQDEGTAKRMLAARRGSGEPVDTEIRQARRGDPAAECGKHRAGVQLLRARRRRVRTLARKLVRPAGEDLFVMYPRAFSIWDTCANAVPATSGGRAERSRAEPDGRVTRC